MLYKIGKHPICFCRWFRAITYNYKEKQKKLQKPWDAYAPIAQFLRIMHWIRCIIAFMENLLISELNAA